MFAGLKSECPSESGIRVATKQWRASLREVRRRSASSLAGKESVGGNLGLLPHQFGQSLKEWIDLFEQRGRAQKSRNRVEKGRCQIQEIEKLEICKSLYSGLARVELCASHSV